VPPGTHVQLLQCSLFWFQGWATMLRETGISRGFFALSSLEIPQLCPPPICGAGSRKGQLAARNENHNPRPASQLEPISQRKIFYSSCASLLSVLLPLYNNMIFLLASDINQVHFATQILYLCDPESFRACVSTFVLHASCHSKTKTKKKPKNLQQPAH